LWHGCLLRYVFPQLGGTRISSVVIRGLRRQILDLRGVVSLLLRRLVLDGRTLGRGAARDLASPAQGPENEQSDPMDRSDECHSQRGPTDRRRTGRGADRAGPRSDVTGPGHHGLRPPSNLIQTALRVSNLARHLALPAELELVAGELVPDHR
jgi:hypothetical protein